MDLVEEPHHTKKMNKTEDLCPRAAIWSLLIIAVVGLLHFIVLSAQTKIVRTTLNAVDIGIHCGIKPRELCLYRSSYVPLLQVKLTQSSSRKTKWKEDKRKGVRGVVL